MKRCPRCQELIQDGAKKCPHCGSDLRSRWRALIPWVVAGTIVVLIAIGVRQDSARELIAPSIEGSMNLLRVQNKNRVAWRQTELHLNSLYTCRVGDIAANETRLVPTASCVSADGAKFNVDTHVITRIQVQALLGTETVPQFKTLTY